jgi:hypothetical protein
MNAKRQERLALGALLLGGACLFTLGSTWGLPSRAVDRYLFGDHPIWSGRRIQELAGEHQSTSTRGADVDVNPLATRDRLIQVNSTDAQRAEIIRRYRLYTDQPDEMVTMMALREIKPGRGQFDPKLYQYGGLWIYPVGALLKCVSLTGLITLTSDVTYYLDHPEAFGRFYVVARAWVIVWALLGVWATFRIAHRMARRSLAASATAAACFIAMPVVVNMAHEAKPHLPAAVLMLLAVLSAMKCLDGGSRRWWLATCVLCGAAFGMVLSAWPVFAIMGVLGVLRQPSWPGRLMETVAGGSIGLLTYFLVNPYVAINLIENRELLLSNLANTRAMFHVGPWSEAFPHAAWLLIEGAVGFVVLLGLLGVLLGLIGRRTRPGSGWLLAAPAVLVFIQFVTFAAGQPAEYARFGVFVAITLSISAATCVGMSHALRYRLILALVLVVMTARRGAFYEWTYIHDAYAAPSRLQAAEQLRQLADQGSRNLAVFNEPAPYAVPPVNLFDWHIWLMPKDQRTLQLAKGMDVAVQAVDDLSRVQVPARFTSPPSRAPMSWADKTFAWITRSSLQPATREAAEHAP